MKKPSKKSERTLGILSHLQKNIPQQGGGEQEDEGDEFDFDDEDEDEDMPNLLAPKPRTKLMAP